MKIFLSGLIVMISLLSCDKEKVAIEEISVPPAPVISFSRSFYYPADNITVTKSYPLTGITFTAKIADDKSLVIDFDTPYPNGNDNATLVVPADRLKPGFKGDYVMTVNSPSETVVYYQYWLSPSSSNKLLPGSAAGVLSITGYDSKYKTIKGEFNFAISTISDPVVAALNNFRTTNITVSGKFENLVVE